MKNGTLRIGCGSAYGEDDLAPAVDLAERGDLDYLCFDGLAERTLSLAQLRKLEDPDLGYDLRLNRWARLFLPHADRGLKLIANLGAANPLRAAERLAETARGLGYGNVRVAAVLGDDVLDWVLREDPILSETGEPLSKLSGQVVSANAYIGADPLVEALEKGANVVIGGRVADPSLFLAPMQFEFGWAADDWEKKGKGTVLGHLLECGVHVTGGNFADPPYRIVPGLDRLGMPVAEVLEDGEGVVTKLPDTGGMVTVETCKAQLVYEVHDPARYLTPDVVCDMRTVQVVRAGEDRVRVQGGGGRPRPDSLKVLIGVQEGFMGEGEFSLAGPGAYERGALALQTLRKRYERLYKGKDEDVRFDLIGVNAIHGPVSPAPAFPPYEVRVRVAMRTRDRETAAAWAQEAEWQFFGPAGSGGIRKSVRPVLALYSALIDRGAVQTQVVMV